MHDLWALQEARDLGLRKAIDDVGIVENVVQRSAAIVLAYDVRGAALLGALRREQE